MSAPVPQGASTQAESTKQEPKPNVILALAGLSNQLRAEDDPARSEHYSAIPEADLLDEKYYLIVPGEPRNEIMARQAVAGPFDTLALGKAYRSEHGPTAFSWFETGQEFRYKRGFARKATQSKIESDAQLTLPGLAL